MISRYVSLGILILLMLVLGVTLYRVLAPFLLPLFLASVVALIAYPVYNYFLHRTKNRVNLAAGLATSSVVAAVIIPLFVGITVGALQLFVIADEWLNAQEVKRAVKMVRQGEIYRSISARSEQFFPLFTEQELEELPEEELQKRREEILQARTEDLRKSAQNSMRQLVAVTFSAGAAGTTVDVAAKLAWTLMALITFVLALFYFFSEGPKLIEYAIELIPIENNHQQILYNEFGKAIRAVVTSTFLAAIAQGLATSIILWLLGFGHFFLFTILCTLAALIPLAGTWLIWMPCAAILAYQGHWGWALLLTGYGFAFVGMLDNFIRAYVLHSDAELHPLLAFVSVLGGLQVMGLWGVFIAPVIACCLYALIRIFNEELVDLSKIEKDKFPEFFRKQAEQKLALAEESKPPQPEAP